MMRRHTRRFDVERDLDRSPHTHEKSQHTVHVDLPFEDVCQRVSATASTLVAGPNQTAVRHIEEAALAGGLAGFESNETVELQPVQLERVDNDFARMQLNWQSTADHRRLLPHVDAELRIHAVIAKGPHASTAISVVGRFVPSPSVRRHIGDQLFGRRIVDEALGRFLTSAVDQILHQSETPD